MVLKIKELRKKFDMTQLELAKKLNISQTNYSRYEMGKNSPDIDMLIKMADFFHVSIDTLVGRVYFGIDFSKITDKEYEIIRRLTEMTESEQEKLLGYIDGMKNK